MTPASRRLREECVDLTMTRSTAPKTAARYKKAVEKHPKDENVDKDAAGLDPRRQIEGEDGRHLRVSRCAIYTHYTSNPGTELERFVTQRQIRAQEQKQRRTASVTQGIRHKGLGWRYPGDI
ncbi:hypothetical protein NDU88_004054 [Pleurodeles waltl]|uniref:Uncharacterized protein n=1 Tax=Pleurodeles waltl TaxID=8319 RepID=A0AAV7PJX9_PLEWA|nr:hypothetical protein NDU88_004054 [Pleurodeles waltl]